MSTHWGIYLLICHWLSILSMVHEITIPVSMLSSSQISVYLLWHTIETLPEAFPPHDKLSGSKTVKSARPEFGTSLCLLVGRPWVTDVIILSLNLFSSNIKVTKDLPGWAIVALNEIVFANFKPVSMTFNYSAATYILFNKESLPN
jgi:hypothetical protein